MNNSMPSCQMCHRWEGEESLRIAELQFSYVMLNRDQYFPGYVLLLTKKHVSELFHLEKSDRALLMEEVATVAEALQKVFAPTKINYELLGNMVPHIHWHIIPRFRSDPLWPRPIWAEQHDELIMAPDEYSKRIEKIRRELP